jgi:hypothetical protein
MNEMQMLRDHRDAQPGPTPDAVARARARLTDQSILTTRARRPMPSRRWRYALVAAGTSAAAAVAVVVPAALDGDNTQPAYAAERLPNGTIRVTLREFADPAGLQRRLAALGVHAAITYLPYGSQCAPDRATVDDRYRGIQPVMYSVPQDNGRPANSWTFTIDAHRMRPGQTLLWELSYRPVGRGGVMAMGLSRTFVARGRVKPCKRIPLRIPKAPKARG